MDLQGRRNFSLATLLVGVTLLASCFGIMVYSVSLGVAAMIVMSLAMARFHIRRCTTWQFPWDGNGWKFIAFLALAVICCPVAMFATCFTSGLGMYDLGVDADWGGPLAFVLGAIAALQCAELLFAIVLRNTDMIS